MYQASATNFIGRDPMVWWIGQVTDPEKGEWGDSLHKKQAEDGKDVYSHRCRVRIVGYHGSDADLPDKDLPLAHILLPPNTATTGGCGDTVQYQGGEVVVGFFFDGDDGQQPVIFGTLFKQSFIKDEIKSSEFGSFKQTEFKPYTPPKVRQYTGKDKVFEESPWGGGFRKFAVLAGAKVITSSVIAQKQSNEDTDIKIENATACEDNELSKIQNTTKDFIKKMNAVEDIGDVTVDPVFGGIVDKTEEIKLASMKIQNSMSRLMRRGRSWMIQDTLDKLSLNLKDKTPITLQAPVGQAAKGLTDIMFCNIEAINEQLSDYLNQSLSNMLGSILDLPICAVESFMGDMFGQINNILDTTLGGLFDQLNNISGGGIGAPSKTFSKGMSFANILTNALECDAQNCPPNTSFSGKGGVSLEPDDAFSTIFEIAGVNSLINKAEGLSSMLDGLIPDVSVPSIPKVDCKTNVLKCGPPRVDFIGGGFDSLATGSPVVNLLGQIIGVAISNGGSGYKEPPTLTFVDGCNNGFGAGGYAIVKDGVVVKVVMTNGGQQYIPNTTETDMDGNVKELIPDPNANYDGKTSYVTRLSDVIVENAGFGYEESDTLTVVGGVGQAEVELNVQGGRIVGTNVVNSGFGFTQIPELLINSDTGAIAKLSPVLDFVKVDDATQLADTDVPFDRNLPQEAVVTIISCIEK